MAIANTTLQIRKSGITSVKPTTLAAGELAINYADDKLYYKNSSGNISYFYGANNGPGFSTANANNTLLLASTPNDTLSIVPGNNTTITACTTTKTITVNAILDPAFTQANSAFNAANSAASFANGAFTKANTIGTIASQNANAVAITGGSVDGTTVGATTASTGAFTTLIGGADVANYGQLTGGATTKAVEFKSLGTDTNVAYAIQSKGTGAIDLAAGSSGVNISNGGTVTAITGTAIGTSYTSIPTVALTAPTTVGGVQATATAQMQATVSTIASGGTGYTINDILTVVGGTGSAAQITVTAVSGGVITSSTITIGGTYSALPTNPVSVTGGTGSSATFNLTSYGVRTTAYTLTNAGSGYVEQPTVTFSGGGGSGATAYATVGSGTVVKSIGSTMSFYTPAGESVRFTDPSGTTTTYTQFNKNTAINEQQIIAANISNLGLIATGGGTINFYTASNNTEKQLVISRTFSAVNYVQVTGATTGGNPSIQTAGSDANRGLSISSKGTSAVGIYSGAGTYLQFQVVGTNSAVNYLQAIGTTAGNSPSLAVAGSDTNIDLTLTPKGTGRVTTVATIVAGLISGGTF